MFSLSLSALVEDDIENAMERELNGSKNSNLGQSLKTSPIRTPVTENDPLGALQSKDEINGTGNDVLKLVDSKNLKNNSDSIEDCELLSSRMKYDLLIGGLFSHHPFKKKEGDHVGHSGGSRRRDSEKYIQEDGDHDGGSRVPKSATFHNGRDKETTKSKTIPRGSTSPTNVNKKNLHFFF